MKMLPLVLLAVAVVLLAAPPASAQRFPKGAELDALMKKHLAECEVCAKLHVEVQALETDMAALEKQREALRLKRLEAQLKAIIAKRPEAKEQLDRFLTLYKQIAELQDEIRETATAATDIIEGLDLEPTDHAELKRAIVPPEQQTTEGERLIRMHAQRARFLQYKERHPGAAKRVKQWDAAQKKRLEELKKTDPELYEITVKQDELAKKLNDLRISLRDMMIEHVRNAAQTT